MLKVKLVKIGNSRGVRLPKPVIEQCGFGDTVEFRVEDNRVVISPNRPIRKGWAESFQAIRMRGDDALLLDDAAPNAFDDTEWEW